MADDYEVTTSCPQGSSTTVWPSSQWPKVLSSSQLKAAQDKDQVKIKTKIKIEVISSHHNVKQQHTGIQKLRSKLKCDAVSLDGTLGV